MLSLLITLLIPSAHALGIQYQEVVNPNSMNGTYQVTQCADLADVKTVVVDVGPGSVILKDETGDVLKRLEGLVADRFGTLTSTETNRRNGTTVTETVKLISGRILTIESKKTAAFDAFGTERASCTLQR